MTIKMPARRESLGTLLDFIQDSANKRCRQDILNRIRLAAEEALANVFLYAYPSRKQDFVEICLEESEGSTFTIEIHDQGIPFNPLSVANPDTKMDISERKIGGMGIFLIRKMADVVLYERRGDTNILKMIFFTTGNQSAIDNGSS
jgi:anti-sigma regulatory factor (Ser/Thr protein kinase)